MTEFLKSVHIWRRYGQKYGDMFFWLTVYNTLGLIHYFVIQVTVCVFRIACYVAMFTPWLVNPRVLDWHETDPAASPYTHEPVIWSLLSCYRRLFQALSLSYFCCQFKPELFNGDYVNYGDPLFCHIRDSLSECLWTEVKCFVTNVTMLLAWLTC